MDSNHRFLGVGQKSLPLDHGIRFNLSERKPWEQPSTLAIEASERRAVVLCSQNYRGLSFFLPHRSAESPCFRPDGFRICKVAGAGIEPTSRRSERRILPLNDPAMGNKFTELRGQESNLRTRRSKRRISTSRNYPALMKGTGGTRTHALVLNGHLLCR